MDQLQQRANRRHYLQQIVKEYQQTLMDRKPKPNNSELVVRNWWLTRI